MSVYSGTKQDGWNEYMLYGGLPLVLRFEKPEEKIAFLKSLFEETYISDIVGRHKIRNRAELEDLLNILSSAIGSLTNPTKLSATFKNVKEPLINELFEFLSLTSPEIFSNLRKAWGRFSCI
jgi:predicted AAA+ superfamily ATPase